MWGCMGASSHQICFALRTKFPKDDFIQRLFFILLVSGEIELKFHTIFDIVEILFPLILKLDGLS